MKETIDIFKILGEKKEPQLDVFKIMNSQVDDDQLDVSKILSDKAKQNQEQQNAPDFDLYQSTQVKAEATPEPQTTLHEVAPEPKPAPQPVPQKHVKPVPQPVPQKHVKPVPQKPVKPVPQPVPQKPAPEPKPAPQPVPQKPAKQADSRRFSLIRLIIKLAVFVIAVELLFMFVIAFPKISMNSMEPMISDGDRVIVSKLTKSFRKNDIIVFKDDRGRKMAARIVAVKGDVVNINNTGGLYVNNKLREEEDISAVTTITDAAVSYPVIVDEDSYFVLGDNRTDSVDSRNSGIGLIESGSIYGKVIFCFKK